MKFAQVNGARGEKEQNQETVDVCAACTAQGFQRSGTKVPLAGTIGPSESETCTLTQVLQMTLLAFKADGPASSTVACV